MKLYKVSVSSNKRTYEASELVEGEILAENEREAIEAFIEMLRDDAADNNLNLDIDGNLIFSVDEDGSRAEEHFLKDSIEATEII
ncbi:MAG TPA: hypothetical protein VFD23_04760 [Clostridia bacterium]|nr:hypothetical protein [Clostridia bacterium]